MLFFPAMIALAAMQIAGSATATSTSTAASPPRQIDFLSDPVLRFTVPVRIGGETRHFIVDTGAEKSGISVELARSLGLQFGAPWQVTGFAGTFSIPTVPVSLEGLSSGHPDNLTVLALSRNAIGADGFLGLDTLRDHVIVFDFTEQRMVIQRTRRSPGYLESGANAVAQMKHRGSRLVFSSAKTNGVHVQAVLDTGSSLSVGNAALKQELMRKHKYGRPIPIRMLAVTGEQIPAELVVIRDLWIGTVHIRNMPIAFAGAEPFQALELTDKPALLLGMDVLREFDRVEIDFPHNQVWFTAKPNTGTYIKLET